MNIQQKINRIKKLRGYQKMLSKNPYNKNLILDVEDEIASIKDTENGNDKETTLLKML